MSDSERFTYVPNSSPHSQPTRVMVVFVENPITLNSLLPFIIIGVIYSIIAQALFTVWKKYHQQSFNLFILAVISIFPLFVFYIFNDFYFLGVWALFSSYILYLCKVAYNFHNDKTAPKMIYNSFKQIFMVTNHLTLAFQGGIVLLYF